VQREGLTPDDMDDPDLAVAGPLMSAIANQPATGIQLFRGARATPAAVAAMQRGSVVTLPLSSFASSSRIGIDFAHDPTQGGLNPGAKQRIPDDATIPVLYILGRGARAGNIAHDVGEFVTTGDFRIAAQVAVWGDGTHVVFLRQITPIEGTT